MTIQPGERVPTKTLKILDDEGFRDIATDRIFAGRKVALFGVPGPFTPTCSIEHLPGFVDNADALMEKGVDRIVCMAVADAFVMKAWGDAHGVGGKIMMVSDGNCELTRAMGLELDASEFLMGMRCRRFSMIVEDGVVREIRVEAPNEFGASGAEALLDVL